MRTPCFPRMFVWFSLLAFPSAALALTNLVWDPNGAAAGYGGNGSWTATDKWFNPSTPGYQGWSSGAGAGFGGTAGTVTLGSSITAAGLGFDVGGYTITGTGTIQLNHPTGDEEIATTTGTTVLDVILSGTGGFSKTGAGTAVLQKSNTLTGTIAISEGTLRLSGGAAIADAAAVSITGSAAGSSLDLNSTSETIGSLAGTGGTVALGTGVLTTGGNNNTTTFSGTVGGSGGLVKMGSGGFTLGGTGGTRSYDLTINDGWVDLGHSGTVTLDSNASIQINSPGSLNVNSDLILDNAQLTRAESGFLGILSGKTLTVQNDGDVTITGSHSQTAGTMTLQGNGTTFTQSKGSSLSLGMTAGPAATLNILNGAVCDTGTGTFIIDRTGVVDFTAGTLHAYGNLVVSGRLSRSSTGTFTQAAGKTLTIQNGGQVSLVNGQTFSNDLTVTGSGSLLQLTKVLSNGALYLDTSTVNVSAGGGIVTDFPAWIGHATAAANTVVNIDGAGSSFDASADRNYISNASHAGELNFSHGATGNLGTILYLGQGNAGVAAQLSVRSGAEVTTNIIDATGFTNASILVSGSGSVLRNNHYNLGSWVSGGSGNLTIEDGGRFIRTGATGSVPTVWTTGTLSINTNGIYDNDLSLTLDGGTLNRDATGVFILPGGKTLTIQNGGHANFAGEWFLETPATVNVVGSGSTLTANFFLIFAGGSSLNVSGGGLVTSYYAWFGTARDGGSATVDGAGSSISALMATSLGWLGETGGLVIRNGATSSLGDLYLAGDETPGTTGTILIESGAQVITGNIEAATGNAATTGTVTVTGTGSALTQTGSSTLTLGAASGSTATLNVSTGAVFTGGTGLATIQPTGTLSVNGGTARFGGAVNHHGTIQLANAGLVEITAACANLGTIFTDVGSTVRVLGALGGGGSFTGWGTIQCEGSLNPGPAAATTFFGGDLTMGANLTTIMHLGGTQRGTQYDAINVIGQLAAGGTLTLSLINGFQPQAGDSFDLFNWGGISGSFARFDLPSLAPNLAWDTSRVVTTGVVGVVTGLPAWRQTHFGTTINFGDAASTADPDKDELNNLLEYAFGLHPLQNSVRQAPGWQRDGNNLVCSFDQPDGVSGITYGAEWSTTMTPGSWQPLADTGTPPQHTFTLPMSGSPRLLVRLKVTSSETPPPPGAERFSLIPAGSFQMGDQSKPLVGYANELPVHTVFVSALFMGKCSVTTEEWDEVQAWGVNNGYPDLAMGNGGYASKGANHPVHSIVWYDMMKWCNARSQKDGLTPCYYTNVDQTMVYKTGKVDIDGMMVKWSANGYRLPTEAEWEKAARGGAVGQNFPWGDTISQSQANYMVFSMDGTTNYFSYDVTPRPPGLVTEYYHPTYATGGMPYSSPVGSFAPNGYGLHDMTGNMWEWCWDWHSSDYYAWSPGTDPRGPSAGSGRVIRGGSYSTVAGYCRIATRSGNAPDDTGNYGLGFRVARSSVP
ncbi:MAG: SUMF1/EgtB/PvdO family nonheme iron enzyme [Verrucomicrobia bacterium]|nr:SUMF1/EgtB/PvdO family nonheme iron enzyme [Verrucomicrobiota bacterium]